MKQAFLLFCGMSLAAACLITNCPRGGKRGFASYLGKGVDAKGLKNIPPQCIRCGPGGEGRCLGPELCCGPRIGCLMASPGISTQCMEASFNPPVSGSTCIMSSGLGVCTVDGICCNSESCRFESTCEVDPYYSQCSIEISENESVPLK